MPQKSTVPKKSDFKRNPNYVRNNPAKNRVLFRWNKDGTGKITKIFGLLAMLSKTENEELVLSSKERTEKSKFAWEELNLKLPQIFTRFEQVTGRPLKKRVFMDRLHKMFYGYNKKNKHQKSSNCSSPEHPLNHKDLQKYYYAVKEVYDRGGKFTDDDIAQILANVDHSDK